MRGIWTERKSLRGWMFSCGAIVVALCGLDSPALAVVKFFDGFGDADRDNNGVIEFYDTDLNDSGTWNMPGPIPAPDGMPNDQVLLDRGLMEVTAAQDPSDIGIVWSGIRSFDTAANIVKCRLRIINDSVAIGSETSAEIHNSGLALGVEARGGGSSFIGRFGQSVEVGPVAGDKLVVSFDFRGWEESANPTPLPGFNEFRWGLYEDTDDELGLTGPYGIGFFSAPPGATVEWGKDDGNWFATEPGAEGDKGIRANLTLDRSHLRSKRELTGSTTSPALTALAQRPTAPTAGSSRATG